VTFIHQGAACTSRRRITAEKGSFADSWPAGRQHVNAGNHFKAQCVPHGPAGQDSVFGFMRWSASRTGSDINRVEEPFARANSSTSFSVSPLDFSSYPIASTESRIPLFYLQQIPSRTSATTPNQGSPRFRHHFTNRGRPDVSATKLALSSAMPGCALSSQASAFVGGGTALYLH
jgi:hypothetical protein